MNGKHTPGPYHCDAEATTADSSGKSVEFLVWAGKDNEDPVYVGMAKRFEDARLFAAAPKLLEAAKKVLAKADDVPARLRTLFELGSAVDEAEGK